MKILHHIIVAVIAFQIWPHMQEQIRRVDESATSHQEHVIDGIDRVPNCAFCEMTASYDQPPLLSGCG